ncbi:MAG: carboxypeptidase regulatory-like domain-containing protein, partial [Caldilineaceae bacterium]|nr:carboxypeptidase regulatory-like domain-containing protein [Caldilineaceae bacterium]
MKDMFLHNGHKRISSSARRLIMVLLLAALGAGLTPSPLVTSFASARLGSLVAALLPVARIAHAQSSGNITIVKNTVGGDGTFTFASDDVDLGGLSIATTNSTGRSATFVKPSGPYTITEEGIAGWTLANIEVTGDTDGGSTWRIVDRQVVIDLDADEAITVTFTNAASPYTVNTAELSGISSNGAPVGPVASGVPLLVVEVDYGDLPDGSASSPAGLPTNSPRYNTDNTGVIGANHAITAGLSLGAWVDGETDGQPAVAADGDDTTGVPDDEDGIILPEFRAGQTAAVIASAINTTGMAAYVYGFIDFDGDGAFAAPDEVVSATVPSGAASQNVNLLFNVPANGDTIQMLGARFRLSTDAGLGPDGSASNGEVEDYLIQIIQPMSLGNRVWIDLDNDGQIDANEDGMDGVLLNLLDGTGAPVLLNGQPVTTTTDNGGYYLFDNLIADDYIIEIAPANFQAGGVLAGYHSSTDSAAVGLDEDDNPVDSDDNGVDDAGNEAVNGIRSTIVTLAPQTEPQSETDLGPDGSGRATDASSNLQVDFGFFAPIRVGDRVWYDYDADGIQDNPLTEQGAPDIEVQIFNADGSAVTDIFGASVPATLTDASGLYTFTNLLPGEYYVQFNLSTLPAGYLVTEMNTSPDGGDSDADPVTGQTRTTGFLPSGSQYVDLDMGLHALVSVGDRVWDDLNHNGIQDVGVEETLGVSDVVVSLYNASTGLPMLNGSGQLLTDVTDANGYYLFENLLPGRYLVQFDLATLPLRYEVTLQDVDDTTAAGNAVDSDADPVTGRSDATPFLMGDPAAANNQDLTLDMGIWGAVSVGDTVWYDNDRNGVYDPAGPDGVPGNDDDELGVEGVTIRLFNADGSPYIPAGGAIQLTTSTNQDGHYLFTALPPGDYFVEFDLATLPAGYVVTEPNKPLLSDEYDSDADPATGQTPPTGTLLNGEQDLSLDMGVYQPASLGDYVWLDRDGDGVQESGEPGIEGVRVELFSGDGASTGLTTTTDADGFYAFTDLAPGDYYVVFTPPTNYQFSPQDAIGNNELDSDADPVSGRTAVTTLVSGENDPTWDAGLFQDAAIGNYVWLDIDADGITEAGEEPIAGVKVTLYAVDADGNETQVATATTDENGFYGFTGLTPGAYFVEFQNPNGLVVTPGNRGSDDARDSDVSITTNRTSVTTLDSNEYDPTWDAGFTEPASIGNYVWNDGPQQTANGIFDEGERGVGGVVVILKDADGNEVVRTTTDANGYYEFTNLTPGDYAIEVILPAEYEAFTTQNIGDDSRDSDVDANGNTQLYTLQPGENNITVWGGLVAKTPTAIDLVSLTGTINEAGNQITVRWETSLELNTLGFH